MKAFLKILNCKNSALLQLNRIIIIFQMQQDDFRRNRDKYVSEIRKSNRDELITKSRKRLVIKNQDSTLKKPIVIDERFQSLILKCIETKYSPASLKEHCSNLQSQDISVIHESVIAIRKILSEQQSKETIQGVVDSGVIPLIINFMKQNTYPQIQLQACWIITNIASGSSTQCQSIVEKGCIDVFLQLLYQNKQYVNQQALWGIGNIAGDCAAFRDKILAKGGHECLMKIVENSKKLSVIRQGVWALSNLCRGAPLPKYEIIKPIIPILCKTIANDLLSGEQLLDALWAVVNNSQGQKSRVQRVIEVDNFPPKLIAFCYSGQIEVMTPCLRIFGNISTGNQKQTQVILKIGGLKLFQQLLDHPKKNIRREVCWILSNICAGTKNQIAQVVNYPYLLYKIALLFTSDDNDIKKEICHAFANMCHLGDVRIIYNVLVDLKVVENYIVLISQDDSDVRMLEVALLTLFDILSLGQRVEDPNPFVKMMQAYPGCFERLQLLQHHQSHEIYKLVIKIFQRFFSLEDNNFL